MAVPCFDLDASLQGGSGAAAPSSAPNEGLLERAFAKMVWQASRPSWAQAGWWDAELRPEARDLLPLPVGPELQRRLDDLASADRAAGYRPGECPLPHTAVNADDRVGIPGRACACHVVTIAAWTAVASWVAAQADAALLAVAGSDPREELLVPARPDLGTVVDPTIEELAPALRVSPGSARHRLEGLRRLARLPRLRAAVGSGLVIGWHAHLLVTDLRHLPEGDRAKVIHKLLDRLRARRDKGLREWTLTDLRAQAKRIAARLDLVLAARRKECHRNRGLRLHQHGHGSATLSADLADDVATRIFRRLTAMAHGLDSACDGPDGARSLDQRRADVFTDLLLASPTSYPLSATRDSGASVDIGEPGSFDAPSTTLAGSEVAVVIDVATLLRLTDTPAEMAGCGPVPAEIARQLAADTRWRTWITATTTAGTHVITTSPGTYRPTAAVARLIRAREPECRMPGCRSTITDLDHVTPFPKGGTTPENLGPLCRRHHRLKTHSRWRQHAQSGGGSSGDVGDDGRAVSWTWTSPSGISHTDHPDPPLA